MLTLQDAIAIVKKKSPNVRGFAILTEKHKANIFLQGSFPTVLFRPAAGIGQSIKAPANVNLSTLNAKAISRGRRFAGIKKFNCLTNRRIEMNNKRMADYLTDFIISPVGKAVAFVVGYLIGSLIVLAFWQ